MKHCLTATFLLLVSLSAAATKLPAIKNIYAVNEQLISAGLPEGNQLKQLQQQGFKHVISLLPGIQLKEKRVVENLGMSFEQIPVDWMQPTLENFQQFVALMNGYKQQKVFVHCQLNWRASAFVYLYRVTQLGESSEVAKADMLKIWQPHDHWQSFINQVEAHYGNS